MPVLDPLRRRPLLAYFGLTFAITWSLVWLFASLPELADHDAAARTRFLGLVGAMLAGPSLAALLLTLLMDGTAGVRSLVHSLKQLGEPRSWLVGLATAPLLILLSLGVMLALGQSAFTPGFVATGLLAGLAVAAFEEFGWTGFATPRLIDRFGAIRGGLVLGVLWALWHAPADLIGNAGMPLDIWAVRFALFFLVPVTAYRVLMTIAYARTRSPALAIAMHASWTGWLLTLSPNVGAIPALPWYALLAGLTVTAALVAARRFTPS